MTLYEAFYKKKLPEKLQKDTEGFASAGNSTGEVLFRIGYYIGRHFEEYAEQIYEINEKEDGENDGKSACD